jgi:hypothetical protein
MALQLPTGHIHGRKVQQMNEPLLGRGIISTLLKVDAWTSSIQSDTPAFVPTPLPGATACEVIEQFAQALVSDATGIEKLLLLKSLQEAFFYSAGLDTDISADEITDRLKGFVNRRGEAAFIEQFLSLYFFNYVWLDESRLQALPVEDAERSIQVETMCRRAVVAAYAEVRDRSTAETLIRNIEAELRRIMSIPRDKTPLRRAG